MFCSNLHCHRSVKKMAHKADLVDVNSAFFTCLPSAGRLENTFSSLPINIFFDTTGYSFAVDWLQG